MNKASVMGMLVFGCFLVGNRAQADEDRRFFAFGEKSFNVGIGIAFDERFELDDEGYLFYGGEASLDLMTQFPITIGIVSSFVLNAHGKGAVLTFFEPGLRIGYLLPVMDKLWIHPFVIVGPLMLKRFSSKENYDGSSNQAIWHAFMGMGSGLRWMMSNVIGLSADFLVGFPAFEGVCVKLRLGVLFSF